MGKKRQHLSIGIVANNTCYTYNFRLGLLRRLKEEGFSVYVISPKDHYSTKLVSEGFTFIHLPISIYNTNPLNELGIGYKLWRIYKKIGLDFVFHFTAKPNVYGSIAAYFCGIPSIAITTGLGIIRNSKRTLSKQVLLSFYRLAGKLSKEIWFLNESDRSLFLEKRLVKREKTFILHSEGVNITWFNHYSRRHLATSLW